MRTVSKIVKNCSTGEETIETYEIPDPTPEEIAAQQASEQQRIIAELTKALEAHYDLVAQAKKYDNRLTCALRAGYAGPFKAEGTTFAIWMDTCNAYAYQVMGDVLNGLRSIPTAEELIAELPAASW